MLVAVGLPLACGVSTRVRTVVAWRRRPSLPSLPDGLRPIWIHAASVGEVEAARGLIPFLPGVPVLLTTSTPEGMERAVQDGVGEFRAPLPLEDPPSLERFLSHTSPRCLVLMESELWPQLLAACNRRAVPVAVAGARLSPRSARRWAWLGSLASRLWSGVRVFAVATPGDSLRFASLGVIPERLRVTGRLKLPSPPPPSDERRQKLRHLLGGHPALVAGSIHPREVDGVLRAAEELRKSIPSLRLVMAPRHPIDFPMLSGSVLLSKAMGQRLPQGGVLVLDTLGWLRSAYSEGSLAYVGGGFHRGSHDLMEPALAGIRLVHGPFIAGQEDAARTLATAELAVEVSREEDLVGALLRQWERGSPGSLLAQEVGKSLDGRARTASTLTEAGLFR